MDNHDGTKIKFNTKTPSVCSHIDMKASNRLKCDEYASFRIFSRTQWHQFMGKGTKSDRFLLFVFRLFFCSFFGFFVLVVLIV